MRTLGNLIWILAGGLTMSLLWMFVSILAVVSIVGIPWSRVLGNFYICVHPFRRGSH